MLRLIRVTVLVRVLVTATVRVAAACVKVCVSVTVEAAADTQRTGVVAGSAAVAEAEVASVTVAEVSIDFPAGATYPSTPWSPDGLFLFMAGIVILAIVQTEPSSFGVKSEKDASPPAPTVLPYDMIPVSRTILVS